VVGGNSVPQPCNAVSGFSHSQTDGNLSQSLWGRLRQSTDRTAVRHKDAACCATKLELAGQRLLVGVRLHTRQTTAGWVVVEHVRPRQHVRAPSVRAEVTEHEDGREVQQRRARSTGSVRRWDVRGVGGVIWPVCVPIPATVALHAHVRVLAHTRTGGLVTLPRHRASRTTVYMGTLNRWRGRRCVRTLQLMRTKVGWLVVRSTDVLPSPSPPNNASAAAMRRGSARYCACSCVSRSSCLSERTPGVPMRCPRARVAAHSRSLASCAGECTCRRERPRSDTQSRAASTARRETDFDQQAAAASLVHSSMDTENERTKSRRTASRTLAATRCTTRGGTTSASTQKPTRRTRSTTSAAVYTGRSSSDASPHRRASAASWARGRACCCCCCGGGVHGGMEPLPPPLLLPRQAPHPSPRDTMWSRRRRSAVCGGEAMTGAVTADGAAVGPGS
jgi:hypothetical protein